MMHGVPPAQGRYLIFPMEIIERELNGNLLLASEAVRRGWNVILGTKRTIFDAANDIPNGVIYLKSIMACEINNMRNLKKAGHKLVCLDVEGLVYTSPEEFVTTRLCADTLAELECAMFWGDCQKEAASLAYPQFSQKFFTTGTPIVDFWRPIHHDFYKDQVAELKKKYGPYILLPSSFASVNHYMGEKGNTEIITRDEIVNESERKEFFKFWAEYESHVSGIFHKFLDFLPKLSAAFPQHKVIIRPHPSESHEKWKEAARGLANVTVLFEGGVSPWLLGADAILHWGCTTGVEGYLMNRPVVAYNPVDDESRAKFDHKVPHSISVMTRTEDEAISALKDIVNDHHAFEHARENVLEGENFLRRWIKYSDTTTASQEIMSILDGISLPLNKAIRTIPKKPVALKELVWRFVEKIAKSSSVRRLLPEHIKFSLQARAYGRHKTRIIDENLVRASINSLCDLRGLEQIGVRKLGANLFLIHPAGR